MLEYLHFFWTQCDYGFNTTTLQCVVQKHIPCHSIIRNIKPYRFSPSEVQLIYSAVQQA
ncbi:hypothetical protein HanXRQr2_Chr01g0007141 [Helianthus annuus]|uniref:Uncharacterized protein n=1 Tax=Helianthus annuus TaxID=4232 RepID=A0A9K3JSF7_HELAN|nr:hypothetical protein HanXRQr2_Chr01g0007141 [Helianthus annuus]